MLLSIRHQCVRIIGVSKLGLFKQLREIGPHCHEDDELVLMQAAKVRGPGPAPRASSERGQRAAPRSALVKGPVATDGRGSLDVCSRPRVTARDRARCLFWNTFETTSG